MDMSHYLIKIHKNKKKLKFCLHFKEKQCNIFDRKTNVCDRKTNRAICFCEATERGKLQGC